MLHPELLDTLPAVHPDAVHSRRDLRVINRFMGNHRWFEQTLPTLLRSGESILELGAGTGELTQRLAAHGMPVTGLDLCPPPVGQSEPLRWLQSDLTAFTGYAKYPVIIGNLILHHFSDEILGQLGRQWRRHARLLLFSEPVRRRFSQLLIRGFGPLFGANRVTLHDATVSIAAGFRGDELIRRLDLPATEWICSYTCTLGGAYRLVARRHP
jgi:2-polyprenyl-3-methyl-5-hydroxy-6-metoxy-1,4-benzoquinol methylase